MSRSTNATYKNDDLELCVDGKSYRVDVEATASYYYDPGCMYKRNGDPGYPPDESFDIEDIYATWYDYNEEKDEEFEVVPTERMASVLEDYLHDIDRWSFESDDLYDYEPDYD